MDVRLTGIVRDFGPTRALDGADFSAGPGGIHALVGENGAGKTTLMRVLFGALEPDQGTVELDGRAVHFRSQREAIAAGIGMVSQHDGIIPELTCLQNLVVGAEPGWLLSPRRLSHEAASLAGRVGFDFDWEASAETLSPASKQKLEILRLLWRRSQVLILDEPTAMLSPSDSDALFDDLKGLCREGRTVIVVTHRLPEVFDHCETVTVLRGGRHVATTLTSDTTRDQLAEMIVGHSVTPSGALPVTVGQPVLEVRGVSIRSQSGRDTVRAASLTLRSGETVGIAGVDGNGQRELFHALTGRLRVQAGTVEFDGRDWTDAPARQRIGEGLRLIPEDRHAEGVVDDWSLELNAALGLQRTGAASKGRLVDAAGRLKLAQASVDKFQTRHESRGQTMASLSGGNQQRFVAGRALAWHPRILLAFHPSRGLDIDGTRRLYEAVRKECRAGACALVVSFDLDELLENCDRILVMAKGRLVEPPPGQERDRAAIGRLMVGAA